MCIRDRGEGGEAASTGSSEQSMLEKYFPIQNIEKGYLIRGDGDITAGFNLLLPERFTLNGKKADQICENFIAILKNLGNGITVHQQNFYYVDQHQSIFSEKDGNIKSENNRYYNYRPVLKQHSRIFITF